MAKCNLPTVQFGITIEPIWDIFRFSARLYPFRWHSPRYRRDSGGTPSTEIAEVFDTTGSLVRYALTDICRCDRSGSAVSVVLYFFDVGFTNRDGENPP